MRSLQDHGGHRISVIEEYESDIERKACEYAESRGWWQSKYTAPGLRAVQDRIFIRRGVVIFIEFKRDGVVLRPQQEKRKRDMIAHGAKVYGPIDSLAEAKKILY